MSKFDKPATVLWSVTGPQGKQTEANKRDFATLREAIRYVRRLPHGSRSRTLVRSAGKRYDAVDCERLEREMKRR